jgi:hypothetical protein
VLGQGPFAANSTGLYVPSGTGNRILWNDQSSTPYYTFFSVASNATPGTSALTYGIFNTSTNLDQDLEQSTVSQGGANYYFAVAAVPEPSTWAMMILGFMGVGFMAYRRRQLVPVVA